MAPYAADSSQPTKASALRQTPISTRIVPAIPFALSRKRQVKKPGTQEEPLPIKEVAQPNVEKQNNVTLSDAPLEAGESAATSVSLDDGDRQSSFTAEEHVTHPAEENGKSTLEGLESPEVADGALTPRADAAIARDVSLEQIQSAESTATEQREAALEVEPVTGKCRHHALKRFRLTLVEESIISNASIPQPKESSFSTPENLPPPFYPSSHRATPSSVTSSSVSQPPSSVPNVPLHNLHPSANGIIFGEYADSSSSSPAPLWLSTAPPHPYPPPLQAVPNHVHGNSYHLTQGHTFGHTPHFSDPRVPIMYPMPFHPSAAYGPGGDRPSHHAHSDRPHGWVFPSGQVHHPVPDVEQKPADYSPQHANGDLPEPSAAAGAAQETSLPEAHSDSAISSLRSSHISLTESHSEVDDDSIHSLTKYLASQFGNRHFADYIIQLFHVYNLFPPAPIPAHRLIIARSPTLLALMTSNDADPRLSPKLLKVPVADDFTNIFAFTEALKYLYGLPLLSRSALLINLPPLRFDSTGYGERTGSGTAVDRMGYVLAYAASGFLLQLDQVVTRGVEVAEKLLRWDTLGVVLAFALDGGLDVSWISEPSPQHQDKRMSDMSVQPEHFSAPRFGTYATRLLRNIVSFLVLNIPKEFEFDSGASQLKNVPRIPVVVDSWAPSSNPRLSHIRFGEVPVEETPTPKPVDTLLSSIFLSLPFPVLQCIFESSDLEERVGSERFMQNKRKVIEERESRRRKAIEGRTVPSYNRVLDEALWRNTLWAEKLERVGEDTSGLRLVRERQEPHTPDSGVSGIS